MSVAESEMLCDVWYMAVPGRAIKRGKMLGKMLLGQSLVLGRDSNGEPFALRDICPHRGIPLSRGVFDGREIECCYHGWRFTCDGGCSHIPSLARAEVRPRARQRHSIPLPRSAGQHLGLHAR